SRPGDERVEVILDPYAHVAKRPRIAGAAQRRDVGLREAPVARPQLVGERYVADGAPAVPRDDRLRDVVERRARAGAHVEDAGDFLVLVEPEVHVGDVADMDEV